MHCLSYSLDFAQQAVFLMIKQESMLRLKQQLKLFLEHFHLSAAELARRSGVPKQTISFWLAGGEPRKIAQLRKVARAFGTSLDHLCFGDGVNEDQTQQDEPLNLFLGSDEGWVSGIYELKVRRVKK